MTSPLRKRLQILLSVLSVLAALLVIAGAYYYLQMRGSLAQLDGRQAVAGLSAPVKIERDALGVPLITGATRLDVSRATGFLHAQERFFQMDLLRRRAAGELAELFGQSALEMDKLSRRHGFRRQAAVVYAALPVEHRALLDAYVAGVNAGLGTLAKKPWEYLVLRVDPVAWTAEDSLLCIYAMWFDLQDDRGHYELATRALHDAFGGSGLAFFGPRGTEQDAALDGSLFPVPELPALRLSRTDEPTVAALSVALGDEEARSGSNNFAVSGAHTATGAPLLANDPHLGLNMPNIWYRAALVWRDDTGAAHRVVGSTLPGTPVMIIGSNGHVAWGFTNAYLDTVDLVVVETYVDLQYRTPEGWRDIDDRSETISVKGGEAVKLTTRWTAWGPIIGPAGEGRSYALRWAAHDSEAVNLEFINFETVRTCAEAVAVAHRAGMPHQNLLVADKHGRIAWTVTGFLPQRVGFDGRLPSSWAYGDRKWNGWIPHDEVPTIADPVDGLLWTANNRVVGGEAYAKLGAGGYANGFRASAIRDSLRALTQSGRKITEADLLGVQLEDRAPFLDRWRELLLQVISDDAAKTPGRRELRELARQWKGHAAADSAGYRIIRGFRLKVAERSLAPFVAGPQNRYERFSFGQFMTEDAVWRLIHEQPARLLNPEHRSWESLLLAAVDDVIADAAKEGIPLADFTWGARNRLRMQHPFSRFLPAWLGGFLDAAADPLPGDTNTARVQTRTFGASMRFVVTPGREEEGLLHMPGGQSGHPLSPFYRAGHRAWASGEPMPLLPGKAAHTLTLAP